MSEPSGLCSLRHICDSAVVLLVAQPNERNAFDQRWIEYRLHSEYAFSVVFDI